MATLTDFSVTMIVTQELQDLRDALKQESELRVYWTDRAMTNAETIDKLERHVETLSKELTYSEGDADRGWLFGAKNFYRAERAERIADEAINMLFSAFLMTRGEAPFRLGFTSIADLRA